QEIIDTLVIQLREIEDVLSTVDISKAKFEEYRWQENKLRLEEDYYKSVVENKELVSEWLTELREITKRTDLLLTDYDNTPHSEKLYLGCWYNKRIQHFNQNYKGEDVFQQ